MEAEFNSNDSSNNYQAEMDEYDSQVGQKSGPTYHSIIVGVGFVILGLLIFGSIPDEILSCDKVQNTCVIEHRNIFSGRKEVQKAITLSSIEKARITNKKGSAMELVARNSTINPILGPELISPIVNKWVREFNSFLNSNRNSIEIKHDIWFAKLFALIFAFSGIFIIFNKDETSVSREEYLRYLEETKNKC